MMLAAPVLKADDRPFIDEHFVQDSVLVLINGAFISAVLEGFVISKVRFPRGQRRAFCQYFAPELTAFIYLIKSQWPTDVMEVWSYLNMALFAGTIAYINYSPSPSVSHVRSVIIYMVYHQIIRTAANAAIRYSTGSNQEYLPIYVVFNGVSAGLITGGLSLWFMCKQVLRYYPSILLMASAGVALISTLSYFFLDGSDAINFSERAGAVTIAGVIAGVGALALVRTGAGVGVGVRVVAGALAEVGVLIGAVSGALAVGEFGAVTLTAAVAVAEAGAGAVARAVAGTVTAAGALAIVEAGAVVGAFIIVITGSMTAALSQSSVTSPIIRGLTMTTAAGLPLMVSSWLVSWNKYVGANATAHETMQDEFIISLNRFIISLNKLKVFYPESWINPLQVWESSTD